jgi:hypothetical protein
LIFNIIANIKSLIKSRLEHKHRRNFDDGMPEPRVNNTTPAQLLYTE